MNLEELQAKVRTLEDIEQINRLQKYSVNLRASGKQRIVKR